MKKKLLFIIWSNSYGGGAERQLTNLVNNLDKNKYEIDLIEYFHTNIYPEKLNSNINVLKPINNKTSESKIKRFLVNILVYIWPSLIRKLYIKGKYDLEISFNYLIPTFLLSKDKNVKKVSWIHGAIFDLLPNKRPRLNRLERKALKNVDRIVAIAEDTKKSIEEIYPEYKEKIKLIYNGYNLDKIKLLAEEKSILKNTRRCEIVYCNRFDDNKNPLLLIEAANLLKNKTNNFHINFLGKGEYESKMMELIHKYSLEENIDIIGYKENPYPYVKNSDIMCLTSKTEGFSNVIIEGMCFGKPFVSTDVGIVKEIKKYNVGLVFKDSSEMCDCLYELIENKEKYKELSNNCTKIVEKFSLKEQVKNAEKLFDDVMNN